MCWRISKDLDVKTKLSLLVLINASHYLLAMYMMHVAFQETEVG